MSVYPFVQNLQQMFSLNNPTSIDLTQGSQNSFKIFDDMTKFLLVHKPRIHQTEVMDFLALNPDIAPALNMIAERSEELGGSLEVGVPRDPEETVDGVEVSVRVRKDFPEILADWQDIAELIEAKVDDHVKRKFDLTLVPVTHGDV